MRHEQDDKEMNGSDEDESVSQPKEARKPLWEQILDAFSNVPEEELESLPVDGAAQVDHYAYGSQKR